MATNPDDVADDFADDLPQQAEQSPEVNDSAEDDALELTIDGEDDAEETPVIKQLRERLRDSQREANDLRQRQPAPQVADIGPRPEWKDGDQYDYDADRFIRERDAWDEKNRANQEVVRKRDEAQQAQTREFERLSARHRVEAGKLSIADFDQREAAVRDAIGSDDLMGAALVMVNDSAKLVAALGCKPALLDKLRAEQNPLRKLSMLKDWEHKMTVTRRKPPEPESPQNVRGNASVSGMSGDKQLEKLRAAAEETGDYSAIAKYKADMRKRA